ncbi:MAG: binding domain protein, partial [Aeromicrobium sp.]|nr:binding domain protein [Aeromicrobium sp.]
MTSTTEAPTTTTPQVAINDIGTSDDFLAAIDKTIKYFNDGDIVEGTIVKVDRDEVLLDIGYKTEGVIPSRELSIKHDVDPNEVVTVGDEIEALVLQKEDKEGRLILSKKRAQYERAWGTIEEKKDNDEVVEGTVIEVVKGGLILDIGLRGFLPASLVEMRRVRDLQPYVGKTLEAKIIELDKNRNNVVLSRRAWLEQTQSEVRSEFLNKLAKGQVRTGVVSSIVNFGAFVDLGGVDGLVHVSELSWKHIDHPSEVVEVGQEVTVEVLDIDLDRERVSLSLKATQEDPWRHFARTHQIGQVVPGKVTKLVPFGAFVRVQDGIEGLVHISELAERHVEIPEQVVNVGDDLLVKVIDIDLDRRRISLSLKQANEGALTDDSFDPAQYGMEAQYDDKGEYIYPEGFDPDTQEWREGFDAQREEWEKRYAAARERFEAHKKQLEDAQKADAVAATESGEATTYSSDVQAADDGGGTLASDEALAALRETPYDVVALDIMLPGLDGLAVLRRLRAESNAVPVLLLTARGEISEKVEGLELGADDYLAKPFAIEELVA